MCFKPYALFPHLSVRENYFRSPTEGATRMETPERVDLNQILLAAHAYKLPIKLSGVQQQRMALGRTTGSTTMVEAV